MDVKSLYQQISLDCINFQDRTLQLSPDISEKPLCQELIASITRFGILHPPIVLEGNNHNSFRIVKGRQRLRVISESLGENSCVCRVLPPDTLMSEVLSLALEELMISHAPTVIEQALCWQKALKFMDEKEALAEFGSRLDSLHRYSGSRLLRLFELDDRQIESLHIGRLEPKTAFHLLDLTAGDRNSLFEIIDSLQLSSSNQKKLVDSCLELSRRQDRMVADILADPECPGITGYGDANPPQKTAVLMNWLSDMKNPLLNRSKREFHRLKSGMNLPGNINLSHSPAFEKDSMTLTVTFRDLQELQKKWPAIRKSLT